MTGGATSTRADAYRVRARTWEIARSSRSRCEPVERADRMTSAHPGRSRISTSVSNVERCRVWRAIVPPRFDEVALVLERERLKRLRCLGCAELTERLDDGAPDLGAWS